MRAMSKAIEHIWIKTEGGEQCTNCGVDRRKVKREGSKKESWAYRMYGWSESFVVPVCFESADAESLLESRWALPTSTEG